MKCIRITLLAYGLKLLSAAKCQDIKSHSQNAVWYGPYHRIWIQTNLSNREWRRKKEKCRTKIGAVQLAASERERIIINYAVLVQFSVLISSSWYFIVFIVVVDDVDHVAYFPSRSFVSVSLFKSKLCNALAFKRNQKRTVRVGKWQRGDLARNAVVHDSDWIGENCATKNAILHKTPSQRGTHSRTKDQSYLRNGSYCACRKLLIPVSFIPIDNLSP